MNTYPCFVYKGGIKGPFTLLEPILPHPDVKLLYMATIRSQSKEPNIIEGKTNFQGKESSFTHAEIKNEFKDQEVICLLQNFVNKHLEGQTTSRITKMFESKVTVSWFQQILFIVKIKNVTIILIMYGFIY